MRQSVLVPLGSDVGYLAAGKPQQVHYSYQIFRECHIEGDWLLIYQVFEDTLILSASDSENYFCSHTLFLLKLISFNDILVIWQSLESAAPFR